MIFFLKTAILKIIFVLFLGSHKSFEQKIIFETFLQLHQKIS